MSGSTLRIATRSSPLAIWQAQHVSALLVAEDPSLTIELIDTATFADKRLDLPISELGGKGAFSKEIQDIVLAGEADLAVHSAKDLQAVTPAGLVVGAFPERGDATDCLVGSTLESLEPNAMVATGSNRRRVQLEEVRPDLSFVGLRGNIATRLGKASEYAAIIMATAALQRLEITPDVVDVLPVDLMIPQVGQGALAVECRSDDAELAERLGAIDHADSRALVEAERGFLIELGGDCDLPAGAHAQLTQSGMELRAVLASPDESRVERVHLIEPDANSFQQLGTRAAVELRSRLSLQD